MIALLIFTMNSIFADDTSLAIISRDFDDLKGICEIPIENIIVWCQGNSLIVNLAETKVIKIHVRDGLDFLFKPNVIGVSFLGVRVDNRLRWPYHLDHLCDKISNALSVFFC